MKRIATALVTVGALGLAGAPPADAAPTVGVAAAVNQDATGRPPGGGVRSLALGDNVIHNERIVTSGSGLVQILLVDGSSFTVGAGSDVVIDEFVYDPAGGGGKLAISFTKGAMRFVGGKISKSAGAVTVNTGIGTIGIRGGIANMSIDPGCQGSGCDRGILSLIFGDELIFSGSGGEQHRIFQAGYTMEISGLGNAIVRPTTPADLAPVQNQLASKSGQRGGTNNPPTNRTVENSPLPDRNSDQPPSPPIITQVIDSERFGSHQQGLTDDPVDRSQIGSDIVRDDVVEHPEPPPPPAELVAFRALTVPETVVTVDGVVTNPGYNGLAGGPGHNQVLDFQVTAEGYAGSIANFGSVVLPEPDANFRIGFLDTVETDSGPADVYAFQNPGTFLYYWMHDVNDVHDFAHLFTGTPTNWTPIIAPTAPDLVRHYDLLPDAHQEISTGIVSAVPFLNQHVVEELGPLLETAASPGLIAVDRPDGQLSRFLTGGFLIDGEGVDQVSLVLLATDTVHSGDNGERFILTSRRGGYRLDAYSYSASHRGGLYSLAGPEGNHFFGQGPDNFVLSSGFAATGDPEEAFFDVGDGGLGISSGDQVSQTVQVADHTSNENMSDLARTTRTLNGYAAAVLEPFGDGAGSGVVTPMRSVLPEQATMRFDAAASSVGAAFRLFDIGDSGDPDGVNSGISGFRAVMGAGVNGTGRDRSAFIDDDRYGGTVHGQMNSQNENPSVGTFLEDGTFVPTTTNQPSAYFFNSDLMAQTGFVPASVTLCECKFLEWGWWGARTANDNSGTRRRDYVHLGSWVQGDVSREVDLPLTGSASYSGHAIGNVARATPDGPTQYVAAGNFDMSWDFGARTGNLAISNFDGMTFSGTMGGATSANPNDLNVFGGGISGATGAGTAEGTASGSFVGGPTGAAHGAIGSFDVHGGGVRAAGTFMGEIVSPPIN